MKLIGAALCALTISRVSALYKVKSTYRIHTAGDRDDEPVVSDSVNIDRDASDDGSCPVFTRSELYETLKTNMYDFRSADRVKLSETGEITIPISAKHRTKGRFTFRKRKFKQAIISGYDGVVRLRNPKVSGQDLHLNIAKHAWDGGAFYCQKCRDKSYLMYQYGNHRQGHDGFIPIAAYILTFIALSDVAGCPADVGNSFQVVLIFGNRGKARVVYNYATMQTANALPIMGFQDDKYSSATKAITDIDNAAITAITQVNENSYLFIDWKTDGSDELRLVSNKPLVKPPKGDGADGTQTCGTQKHCVCQNIMTEQDNIKFTHPLTGAILTSGEVGDHYAFSGRCSLSESTMNQGGYGYRGHICYVSPKSVQCKNTFETVDRNSKWLWGTRDIGGDDYDVPAYTYVCADAKGDPNGVPYWQRDIRTAETKLIRKVLRSRKRRSASSYRRYKRKQQKKRLRADQAAATATLDRFCTRDDESLNLCRLSKPDIDRAATRRAKEDVEISCRFTCQHPNVWSDNLVSFEVYNDVDYQNGGEWHCSYNMIDENGDNQVVDMPVDSENDVPEGGWCKLSCPGGDPADTSAIKCDTWNRKIGFKQFNRDQVRDLANIFSVGAWVCT